ncbi:NACHT domain-containing protein, partial [Thiolapillus sp.]
MNKKPAPLSRHQAEKALQSLGAAGVPGEISRTRLSLMATQLDEEGLAPLDRLLELLYPGMDEDQAMEAFRKWRSEINRQLKEQGIDFSVHIDDRRKKPRKARKCWLESAGLVEDPMDVYARRMAERPAAKNPVQSLGEPLDERCYCWLYSADNAAAAEKLIDEMETRFRVARQQDFKRLCNGIAVGDRLREGDRDNLKKADLVICLVDHALLAKPGMDAVLEHAGLFPVALESLTGPLPENLKARQLFLLDEKPFPHNKGARQTEFCNALHKAMADYLEKHPPQRANPFDLHERQVVDHLCGDGMVPTRGRLEHIEYLQREKEGKDQERTGEGIPAVDYLVDWALDSQAPVFCALLGEYGIGKTTTCLMLTRALVERRQQEPDLPRVIYLDLREIGGLAREKAPELEDIVATILKNSWLSPEQPPTVTQVIREVRERRALVIFDGLDEVLVHLDEQQGRRFTRELWRILPPAVYDDEDRQAKVGKVLISCRTHYFRTIDEGRAHFRAEDRDDIRGRDYRALVILPFTREQIRAYLKANLPQRDPDDVIAMFEQIHNLSELAERPFTLSLIGEQIEALESRRLSGKKVNGASLYQGVVDQWLQRDNGKHQLEPRHKVLLMMHLAADLWRHGDRSRHIDQLEDWFMAFIDSHREVNIHYRQALPVVLKEDLRAATFLVHDGEDRFRFAHRSLHEFFLARHLLHALLHGDDAWVEAWELPPVSRETLVFLGQLLELENEAGQRQALGRLAELHRNFRPRVSELAFHYALSALAHGHPRASLRGLQLPGVNLKGMRIAGGGERLDLSGASFTGANLREAEFHRVNLSAADFSDACLDRALLRQSVLREAVFRHTSLAAVRFERSDLRDAGWKEAKFYRSRFIFCDGLPPELKSDPAGRIQRVDESRVPMEDNRSRLYSVTGHKGEVWSCAWSPSGDRVISGGMDGSVRVLDVASGEELLRLTGHGAAVWSCAWSPSGDRVISGGIDGSVRVWDVASGEELLCLKGHEGGVSSCIWSP